ncbi:MAG: hypothetical protein JXR10_02735 [Cyclobacteriaceae bacterium]
MRNTFILLVLGMIALSCQSAQGDRPRLQAYFDLDSLIDTQIEILISNESELTKTLNSQEATEVKTTKPSREEWENEFRLMREFNLNKPHYVGSYVANKQSGLVQYVPRQDQELPVWKFELRYVGGQLSQIDMGLSEFKYIYINKRRATLLFSDNQLISFRIEGSQDMILKDEMNYVISGKIN